MIPSIPQQSLYPSLAALGTSANTAVSPPIPFPRRVINDIEQQQRKALEDTVEGNIGLTNTSPISDVEEQEEEVIIPSLNPQAGITSRYPGGPESLEIEDTSLKKDDTQEDQDVEHTEAQNTGVSDERAEPDSIGSHIEEDGTTQKVMVMTTYLMIKILQCKMIRPLKHSRMTIILLPLMMMILMTQYSLVIHSPNHSCQEVSEYPLQR